MNKNYVFVYGTLMEDEKNHHFLEDCKMVLECSTEGILFDVFPKPNGFPAMVEVNADNDIDLVFGEVYAVDDVKLKKLDYLESYTGKKNSMYMRKKRKMMIEGKMKDVFLYIWNYSTYGLRRFENEGQKWSAESVIKSV